MFEKIWQRHVIVDRGDDEVLLYIDRNFLHEGSFRAFAALAAEGLTVRRPRQNLATSDPSVQTRHRHLRLSPLHEHDLHAREVTLTQNADTQRRYPFGPD